MGLSTFKGLVQPLENFILLKDIYDNFFQGLSKIRYVVIIIIFQWHIHVLADK